ncbi:formylglycine-generating enzyme family protein [Reichenbachiella sp.]|uniref:formylglycine-generating enzyme family protein n=1 Tax=Reichenbachiella sp. TaxID=2184521 RepID=UPI003BAF7F90
MKKFLVTPTFLLIIQMIGYAQTHGESKKFEINDTYSIEMVWIAAGQFLMGSPESESERNPSREKQHQVTLTKGFWIAKTETTQAVWESVMGDNPGKIKSPNHPIESVSWDDTQKFIKKLNKQGAQFRLPYEAEWEYACRAGSTGAYAGDRDVMTWHSGNSGRTTHPVASKEPNAWGLYDMHGHILEMCQDWFTEDVSTYNFDPKGPKNGTRRVQRGGQYTGRIRHSRSADRQSGFPNQNAFFVGFRLVHD